MLRWITISTKAMRITSYSWQDKSDYKSIKGEVHQDDADEIEVEEAQINDKEHVILMEPD